MRGALHILLPCFLLGVVALRGDAQVSFLNDVEPILTRNGCNQGACHGSQFGKGGFKLSLAGYDPDFDHESIVKVVRGRRVNWTQPEASLLLQKPTLMVAHLGGRLFSTNSADYQTLLRWLREGTPRPNSKDPHVIQIFATPQRRILHPNERLSLHIFARYSDGKQREVTAHTRINSLQDMVATVTPEGLVTAKAPGATAIMLRYAGLATVSHIVIPYAPVANLKRFIPQNFVDGLVAKRWSELGLTPSEVCTDTEFLRRVSLDVIGTLPTPEEIRSFLNDTKPNRRERMVEYLLSRPEYADYWAVKWGDLLRSSRVTLTTKGMWSLSNWIRESLYTNKPYNTFVREILTAQGSTFSQSPTNYYRIASSPQELTEATAQLFLGIRIQCARCHQHPFERWSQRDYYQFSAYFARVGFKAGGDYGEKSGEQILYLKPTGEIQHPKTGERMLPTPLGSTARLVSVDSQEDRRLGLANWLTEKENLGFAKTIVNRYWGYLMGRGIVNPVDDMRVTNPPTNPELLEALAQDFIAHGYDLKHLLKTIATSRTYQLRSLSNANNRDDEVFYSHFLARRQSAEVLLDSVCFATGVPEKFEGLPLGVRAIQLPDTATASPFLDSTGRPSRTTVCECERVSEPNLSQVLQLMTGEGINRKIVHSEGRVAKLIREGRSPEQIIETLYLVTLSRTPNREEQRTAMQLFARSKSPQSAGEDLLWALLNTKEFAYIR